ncbi:DgyrCDS14400 [Dimorphilus gyrociliatus]|uniref:DgyrCDS14400 n=1 Tax=Dimorphilus gyrociliatus TaxID=2664684 RepID=A0A7I8WDG7_9ANNE|nr:DgyrCDS14400 [Dimorphilus gyrociliatus]
MFFQIFILLLNFPVTLQSENCHNATLGFPLIRFIFSQLDHINLLTDFTIPCNGYITSITYLTTGEDYPFHLAVWKNVLGLKYNKKDYRTITKTTAIEQRTVKFDIPMEISTTDYLAFEFLEGSKHGIVSYKGDNPGNAQFYKIITAVKFFMKLPVYKNINFNSHVYNKYYAFNLEFIPKNVYKRNPYCSNKQNVYGHDLIDRNEGGQDHATFLVDLKFVCSGHLTKIEFYRKTTDKSHIGIWRKMSDLAGIKYKLITLITLPDGPIGTVQTVELNDTIPIEENDIPLILNHNSKSNAIANAGNSYGDASSVNMNIQKENVEIGKIIDLQECSYGCVKQFRTFSIKFHVDSSKILIFFCYPQLL